MLSEDAAAVKVVTSDSMERRSVVCAPAGDDRATHISALMAQLLGNQTRFIVLIVG
jgi:hypothetical protein